MSIEQSVRGVLKDWRRMGLSNAIQGLKSRSGSGTLNLYLSGQERFTIRRGQSDYDTVRQVWRDEQYKVAESPFKDRVQHRYDALIAQGKTPVIVDAGANVGAASVWFASLYPKAVVVAVEPNPDSVALLTQNVVGRNIQIMPAAIGSVAGYVRLIDEGLAWASQTERAESGLQVVTVADCLASVPNGALFIVKIDIEGFEDDLFAANTGWIDQVHLVYIEPHDWMLPDKHTSRTFQAEMGSRPFQILMRGENLIYLRAQ